MTVTTGRDRYFLLRVILGVVLLLTSVVVPIWIASDSITANFRGLDESGRTRKIISINDACVYNGELWFQQSARKQGAASWIYRLARLDLNSGQIGPTEISAQTDLPRPMMMGNDLYAITSDKLFQIVDSQPVPIGPANPENGSFSNPFLHDGKVSVVSRHSSYRPRMYHLQDGKWVEGKVVLFPDVCQQYLDHREKQPETTVDLSFLEEGLPTEDAESHWLTVEMSGPDNHLFLYSRMTRAGSLVPIESLLHRKGFEVSSDSGELPSAISPENVPPETSRWTTAPFRVNSAGIGVNVAAIVRDGEEVLVAIPGIAQKFHGIVLSQLLRLYDDGRIVEVGGVPPDKYSTLAKDPSDGSVYLITHISHNWNGIEVHRVEGDSVRPAFLKIPGEEREYVDRWRWSVRGVIAAWLAHDILLALTAFCVGFGWPRKTHEWDTMQASIAPIWRRVAAGTVDLTLVMFAVQFVWHAAPGLIGITWSDEEYRNYGDHLATIRWGVYKVQESLFIKGEFDSQGIDIPQYLLQIFQADLPNWIACLVVVVVVLLGIRLYVEGQSGVTPGKLLLGIRTRSTTLNQPGFFSSLIRSLCLLIDDLFSLTPLPAILFMSISK